MRRCASNVAACLLAAMAATPRLGAADDPLAAATAAAEAAASTPEGKRFAEEVGAAFGREHAGTIQSCAKAAKRPDLTDFRLLLRVDDKGLAEEALATPATNLSSCVKDKLAGWKTGLTLPRAPAWVAVEVRLRRK